MYDDVTQGKGTCPECRATIPPHEKPNRVLTCDKIIEGLRPTLKPEQIQNLDERIAEFKKLLGRQAAAAQNSAGGSRGGRGRGTGGRGVARGAANVFFRTPQQVFISLADGESEGSFSEGGHGRDELRCVCVCVCCVLCVCFRYGKIINTLTDVSGGGISVMGKAKCHVQWSHVHDCSRAIFIDDGISLFISFLSFSLSLALFLSSFRSLLLSFSLSRSLAPSLPLPHTRIAASHLSEREKVCVRERESARARAREREREREREKEKERENGGNMHRLVASA